MRTAFVLCVIISGVFQETVSTVTQNINVVVDAPVNMEVGPENAIYCRLKDPHEKVVYDNFGRCRLIIERVQFSNSGVWRMYVGLPNEVVAQIYLLNVDVRKEETAPQVQTSFALSNDGTSLTVSCSVETTAVPRLCEFRTPDGQILLPQEGANSGRYSFHGNGVSKFYDMYTMDCGLNIFSPNQSDLGFWRCGINTEDDSHYGFLLVNHTSLMNARTITQFEPTLRSNGVFEEVLVGESVTMSCTIPSSIRYCYFRSHNGTILTMLPGEPAERYEYVGNGFDAGECGVRLKNPRVSDSGDWTCHVGISGSAHEQNATILLLVRELMVASLRSLSDRSLVVNSAVLDIPRLEYCRFVRSDGFGFTNDDGFDHLPDGYSFTGNLAIGTCDLEILRPTAADLRRWTVAAKVKGRRTEIVAHTDDLSVYFYWRACPLFLSLRIIVIVFCIGLIFIAFGLLLGPKKNRQWTYTRAAAARDTIRRSFRKSPSLDTDKMVNSPQAA